MVCTNLTRSETTPETAFDWGIKGWLSDEPCKVTKGYVDEGNYTYYKITGTCKVNGKDRWFDGTSNGVGYKGVRYGLYDMYGRPINLDKNESAIRTNMEGCTQLLQEAKTATDHAKNVIEKSPFSNERIVFNQQCGTASGMNMLKCQAVSRLSNYPPLPWSDNYCSTSWGTPFCQSYCSVNSRNPACQQGFWNACGGTDPQKSVNDPQCIAFLSKQDDWVVTDHFKKICNRSGALSTACFGPVSKVCSNTNGEQRQPWCNDVLKELCQENGYRAEVCSCIAPYAERDLVVLGPSGSFAGYTYQDGLPNRYFFGGADGTEMARIQTSCRTGGYRLSPYDRRMDGGVCSAIRDRTDLAEVQLSDVRAACTVTDKGAIRAGLWSFPGEKDTIDTWLAWWRTPHPMFTGVTVPTIYQLARAFVHVIENAPPSEFEKLATAKDISYPDDRVKWTIVSALFERGIIDELPLIEPEPEPEPALEPVPEPNPEPINEMSTDVTPNVLATSPKNIPAPLLSPPVSTSTSLKPATLTFIAFIVIAILLVSTAI